MIRPEYIAYQVLKTTQRIFGPKQMTQSSLSNSGNKKESASAVLSNFNNAFPEASILICYPQSGQMYEDISGNYLLTDENKLKIYKLKKNNAPNVCSDEIKEKIFMWVYDSKSLQPQQRLNLLKQKTSNKFPNYNCSVILGRGIFWKASGTKGTCEFKMSEYGYDIIVLLS